MLVIYAEKSSLAKAIANALGAGNRISYPEEPKIGYYDIEKKRSDLIKGFNCTQRRFYNRV